MPPGAPGADPRLLAAPGRPGAAARREHPAARRGARPAIASRLDRPYEPRTEDDAWLSRRGHVRTTSSKPPPSWGLLAPRAKKGAGAEWVFRRARDLPDPAARVVRPSRGASEAAPSRPWPARPCPTRRTSGRRDRARA